jgi:hypothetical protein
MDAIESSDTASVSWNTTSARTQMIIIFSATALANQYGFWRVFNVAIFEHIGISDIPRLAMWPLISGFAGVALGCFIAYWAPPPPPSAGAPAFVSVVFGKFRIPLGLGLLLLGFTAAIVVPPRFSAYLAPLCLSMGLSTLMVRDVDIPLFKVRISPIIASTSILLLGFAYGQGVARAVDIRDAREYVQASFATQPSNSLRYLGRAGDNVFLYDPNARAAVLYEIKSVEPLTLTAVYTPYGSTPKDQPKIESKIAPKVEPRLEKPTIPLPHP